MENFTHEFSVLVITYNHEHFIDQTIQSILSQKFDGRLQVVIGVDNSKDRTLEICKGYQQRNPETIELIVHDENIGMYKNFRDTLKRCTGKYISILEGDDYWVNENKLQLQFNLFEKFSNCIISAGDIETVDAKSQTISGKKIRKGGKGYVLLKEDLIIINQVHTLTTAFRKDAVNWSEFDRLYSSPHLDWSFYLSLNFPPDGFIYIFPEVFGAYRIHAGGVFSMVEAEKKNQNILKSIYSISTLNLGEEYREYIKSLFANFSLKILQKEMLFNEPYKSFFDPSLIIYDKNNKLKHSFIKRTYKNLFSSKQGVNFWKLDFELLRQTRPSLKTYINILWLPVFLFIIFMKWKDRQRKFKMIKRKL